MAIAPVEVFFNCKTEGARAAFGELFHHPSNFSFIADDAGFMLDPSRTRVVGLLYRDEAAKNRVNFKVLSNRASRQPIADYSEFVPVYQNLLGILRSQQGPHQELENRRETLAAVAQHVVEVTTQMQGNAIAGLITTDSAQMTGKPEGVLIVREDIVVGLSGAYQEAMLDERHPLRPVAEMFRRQRVDQAELRERHEAKQVDGEYLTKDQDFIREEFPLVVATLLLPQTAKLIELFDSRPPTQGFFA